MKKVPPKFKGLLPYFGSKSRIVRHYPEPVHRTIIEPFAGGAAYSLYHYERDVILNDIFAPVVSVWRFLLSKDALHWVHERVPHVIHAGTTMDQLVQDNDPEGLVWLMRSAFACGSFGQKGTRSKVSPLGAWCWTGEDVDGVVRSGTSFRTEGFRARLEYWIPRIAHWQITMLSYAFMDNRPATWYVDPPYNNAAGATYSKGSKDIDYEHLGEWCQSRAGQVIVCENGGATWMPFEPLLDKRVGIYNDTIKSKAGEVMWHRCAMTEGLW